MSRVILRNTSPEDMPAFAVAVLDREALEYIEPEPIDGPPPISISPLSGTGGSNGLALSGPDIVYPVRQFTQDDFDRGDYVVFVSDQQAIRSQETGSGFVATSLHRVRTVRENRSDTQEHTKNSFGLRINSWYLWRGVGHFSLIGADPAQPLPDEQQVTSTVGVSWCQFAGIPQAFVCRTPATGIPIGESALCRIIENRSAAFWLQDNTQADQAIKVWNAAESRAVASNKRIQAKLEWHTKRYVVDVEECGQ